MKKVFSVLLVLAIAISLVACGAKVEEKILGKWTFATQTIIFNADHTGELLMNGESRAVTWSFDEGSRQILVTMVESGMTDEGIYRESDDTINVDGAIFERAAS